MRRHISLLVLGILFRLFLSGQKMQFEALSYCQGKRTVGTTYVYNPGRLPQFPGGDSALQHFTEKNFPSLSELPKEAAGHVTLLDFTVDASGTVRDIHRGTIIPDDNKVLSDVPIPIETLPEGLLLKIDSYAINFFCSMPDWIPGGKGDLGKEGSTNENIVLFAKLHFPVFADGTELPAWVELQKMPVANVPGAVYSDSTDCLEINESDSAVFYFAETMAAFPGGDNAFLSYFANNISIADDSSCASKSFFVSFIVLKDGRIANVRLAKASADCPVLTQKVLEAACHMPKWKPATMNGRPVNVKVTQRIVFN